MARQPKGFFTPFANLNLPTAPKNPRQKAVEPAPRDRPAPEADDEALFINEMRGVQPLSRDGQRVEPKKKERSEQPDDELLALKQLEGLVRGEGTFDLWDTGEMVTGRAPGVSPRTLNELKRGKIAVRRHIDLHGLSRDDARAALASFILEARRDDQRCVLVVTGRGKSSPGGVSVLREALPRWLTRAPVRPHVLAFCTARRNDGGPGAFYVLLRRAGMPPFGMGSP